MNFLHLDIFLTNTEVFLYHNDKDNLTHLMLLLFQVRLKHADSLFSFEHPEREYNELYHCQLHFLQVSLQELHLHPEVFVFMNPILRFQVA